MQTIEWPFRAGEALDSGALTLRQLRRFHEAIYPGVWMPRGVELTAGLRARAAWLWSGRQAVVAGWSASAMHGAQWVDDDLPAQLIHTNRRPPQLIEVHTERVLPGEVHPLFGMSVTTPARTAFDLGRRLPVDDGVARIDALMRATDVKVCDIDAVIACHPRVRGLRRLREALCHVDGGAESPYESRTILLLVRNGFPCPQTQVPVRDQNGRVFARIDIGWPEYQVGVDFDGAHHFTDPRQRSWDVERYTRIPELGWIDVRLTSGMLHHQPRVFLDRVGAALLSRGCPKTW